MFCIDYGDYRDGFEVIQLSNGGYLTISPIEDYNDIKRITPESSTSATKTKYATYTNSDGEIEWKYSLVATFTYDYGISAVCNDATYTQTIYKGNWTFSNGSATKSGATAHGVGTYKEKVLFITLRTVNVDISITCDKYGQFS